MRKTSFAAAMVAVVSLFTFFQLACQPAADTNRSDSLAPNTKSGREAVDTAAIEAELLRIENDWPRVIKERDVAAVGRVEADDVVIVYPDGNVGTKQQDLDDIANGALTADEINISDLKVKILDSDAAVVSGQTEIKNGKYKMADGKLMDITGKFRFIDTFARRNGEWKLVAGISTKITASPATTASPAASPAVRASPTASRPAASRPTVRVPAPTRSPVATPTP
jgi:ketosteroid isomerase-like protein